MIHTITLHVSKNRYGKPPYDVIKMNMCGDVIGTTGTTQNEGRKGTYITTNIDAQLEFIEKEKAHGVPESSQNP